MYEVFEMFVDAETWYSGHRYDNERFYSALNRIVDNPNLHADEIGKYIADRRNIDLNKDDYYTKIINDLVANAHAVRDFLKRNRAVSKFIS